MSDPYPHGKISPDDKGELKMYVYADLVNNVVRIDFGYPIEWLGLDVSSAENFIKLLEEKIEDIKGQTQNE